MYWKLKVIKRSDSRGGGALEFSHIFHTIGEINTGNARVHAQFQLDLHSFDQNILSFENSLF